MGYSSTLYPYDCVCYITDSLGQGSGVIIGPHTILTASHLLWDATTGTSATDVQIYPGYSEGGAEVTGANDFHYYQINDTNDLLTQASSQLDFAIIDVSQNLSSLGSFGVETNYTGAQCMLPDTRALQAGLK